MPFMEDVAFLLVANGFGTVGTNIFYSTRAKIPVGNGPYVSLIETGGLAPEKTQNRKTKPAYQRPGLQVIVRATDYIVARNRAVEVYNTISAVRNQFVGNAPGTWYLNMAPQQEPFDGGSDEQGRPKVLFNIIAYKRAA